VDVEDPVAELVDRPLVVDELPDEMGGIEVEPEVRGRQDLEQAPPEGRGVREVRAARPLVVAEDHRAVLDRDPDPVLSRVLDERPPDLTEEGESVRRAPPLTPA